MALLTVPVVSNFSSELPLDCVIVPVPVPVPAAAAAVLPMTSVPVLSVVRSVDIQPQDEYYDKKSKVFSAFDYSAIPRGRDSEEDMEKHGISKSQIKSQRPRFL